MTPHRDAIYSLTDLVDVVNGLLPSYLPKDATGRAADDVTPRLVRFYTTEGLLEPAHREGREARYTFGHLLDLLAVRKLLAEGFSSAAIKRALEGRELAEREALLKDEVEVQLVPKVTVPPGGESKADFLSRLRAQAGLADRPVVSHPSQHQDTGFPHSSIMAFRSPPEAEARGALSAPQPDALTPTSWYRVIIDKGLELFVTDDYVMPTTQLGDEQLLQLLKAALLQLQQVTKKR